MKTTFVTSVAIALFVISIGTMAQEKDHKRMDHQKNKQMLEMIKDSIKMNMMMDHIASDNTMRMKMMHKMMSQPTSDTSSMMEMCKTMMGNNDMHSCMKKMMDGKMMKHDGMQKKPSGKKTDGNTDDHNEHHKK